MAEIKVSQLTEASEINDEDLLMIVQNGENKKITKANAKFASGDEVYIGDTEPTGEDDDSVKIWVEPSEDSVEAEGTYISNTYGISTEIGYSEQYSNEHYGGVVLYSNATGTNSEITLSDNYTNYSYMEVFYGWYDSGSSSFKYGACSTKLDLEATNLLHISLNLLGSNWIQNEYNKWQFSTNKLTPIERYAKYNDTFTGSAAIRITKVIGYK